MRNKTPRSHRPESGCDPGLIIIISLYSGSPQLLVWKREVHPALAPSVWRDEGRNMGVTGTWRSPRTVHLSYCLGIKSASVTSILLLSRHCGRATTLHLHTTLQRLRMRNTQAMNTEDLQADPQRTKTKRQGSRRIKSNRGLVSGYKMSSNKTGR